MMSAMVPKPEGVVKASKMSFRSNIYMDSWSYSEILRLIEGIHIRSLFAVSPGLKSTFMVVLDVSDCEQRGWSKKLPVDPVI